MQTTKKLVLIVLVLSTVFATVFAQTSMTSSSTQSLFTTDVDDFMDVNEWHNVMPKKFFGFVGFGLSGKDLVEVGVSKQFKKVYVGTYFTGQPILWDSKTQIDNNGKKIITTKTIGESKTDASVLVGFKNIGIKGKFYFQPKAGNQYIKNEGAKTKTSNNKFELGWDLIGGMNINGPKNRLYKTAARIALFSDVDKNQTLTDGELTALTNNNTYHRLEIGGGVGFDFWQKNDVTQNLILGLHTDWTIYPKKTGYDGVTQATIHTVGRLKDTFTLTPIWTISYEPEGKFAFKAEAGMPVKFHFENNDNYTESVTSASTTTTYNTSRKYNFNLRFEPNLKGAVTWKPFSKLRFNFGAKFTIPEFGWTTVKTETRNAANGSVTATNKKIDWDFGGGDFGVTSGFTLFATNKITVDTEWDILQNLFNNEFVTQLTEGDVQSIWDTANKLFVHNIRFAVSVKM